MVSSQPDKAIWSSPNDVVIMNYSLNCFLIAYADHIYSDVVYWTGDPFCLDWFLKELPTGLQEFCFQARVPTGPIYIVFSPQRFRNPGEIAYEIGIYYF